MFRSDMCTYSSLFKWVHQKSVDLYAAGYILIGDKHDGCLHQFRFLRGTQFPDIREIVYHTRREHLWGRVINGEGQTFDTWDKPD